MPNRPLRIVMMGTGVFAEPTFEGLLAGPNEVVGLFTQPDRAVGTGKASSRLARPGMKELALEHRLPVHQPENINTPDGVTSLKNLNPDLLVVAAYGQILSREVLGVPTLGGINVHASLLPRYRGAAPIHWAIYHGETETGVTIIRMSTQLDAGDMLAQESLPILPDETSGELEVRLAPLGARMALAIVARFAANETVAGVPQDKSQATKAPKLTKEMGLIDWSRSAAQVCCQIRAMQPWPTPYTFLLRSGLPPMRVIVFKATPTAGDETPLPPGSIVRGGQGTRLLVAAGQGEWVEVLEVQPAGKRRMTASEFLRGIPTEQAMLLGAESDSPA